MTIHLDIELADATAAAIRVTDFDLDIAADMPSIEFGVPGPQGPQGPGGSAGAAADQITFEPMPPDITALDVQAAIEQLKVYAEKHGVYVSPTPPVDPNRWGIWVDTS